MKKTNVRNMAESSVMIALAIVLDLASSALGALGQAPLGGKWTLCAMLPIMLISVKNGMKWGFGTAFAYSVIQLGMSIAKVLGWGLTPAVLLGCLFFDYIFAYTVLGFAGIFCIRKRKIGNVLAGITVAIGLRFVCHFISGTVFFGNWADGIWQVISYSLVYNARYLAPDLALTLVVSGILLNVPVIRKMMKLEAK